MKYLWLAFLIGLIGVVCAAYATTSPPVNVPITITGGGGNIACDIGPSYVGSIPAPAAKYGFTHCLNFDFSYAGTFSNTSSFRLSIGAGTAEGTVVPPNQTYQWSNKNSWFRDGNGAGSSVPLFTTSSGFTDTNQVSFVTDPTLGTQVMLLQEFPGNTQAAQMETFLFPNTNMWMELTYKINPNDASNTLTAANGEVIDDFGQGAGVSGTDFPPGGGQVLEIDSGVVCPLLVPMRSCSGAGSFTPLSGEPAFIPASNGNLADGNWHTTGALYVASRNQSRFAYCGYFDHQSGVPNYDPTQTFNCWAPAGTSGNFNTACVDWPYGCYEAGLEYLGFYSQTVSQPVQQWISRLIIWTCPGWNTPGPGTSSNNCDSGSVGIPNTGDTGPAWPSG